MNVLLVDRSQLIRIRIENLIKGIFENAEVFQADSNFDAIKHAEDNIFDIILFDLDLFDGSGFKLLGLTRSLAYEPVKIIFTNHVQNNLKEVSYKLGVDYFLNKSKDFLEMKKILKEINSEKAFIGKS